MIDWTRSEMTNYYWSQDARLSEKIEDWCNFVYERESRLIITDSNTDNHEKKDLLERNLDFM